MATETYKFLGKVTADGSSSVMTLAGIPQTHRDIEIIFQAKTNTGNGAAGADITLNGDTGSNYRQNGWGINGLSQLGNAQATTHFDINYGSGPGNVNSQMMGWCKMYLLNYTNAVDHPGWYMNSSWDNYTTGAQWWNGVLYNPSSAAAITSVTWTAVYTLEANCSIAAYGIDYS